MNDAQSWDGELDGARLDWHKGRISRQASRDQLDPPNWNHTVRGARWLLRVQGQVTEQVSLGLCSRCL